MEPGKEEFLKSVRVICPHVTDSELAQFASKLTLKEFKKKDLFVQSGKTQTAIGFIAKGLTRSFFMDHADEITIGFYAEDNYVAHYSAFNTQQPSRYSI